MKLFVFNPNKIGYDTWCIMSETIEDAIENLSKDSVFRIDLEKYTINELYEVEEYGLNEHVWIQQD